MPSESIKNRKIERTVQGEYSDCTVVFFFVEKIDRIGYVVHTKSFILEFFIRDG